MRFGLLIVYLALSATISWSQRHARTDSVQNYRSIGVKNKQSFPRPNWDVRYRSGSFELKQGQWLKVALVPEETPHKNARPAIISVDRLRETYKQTAPLLTVSLDQLRAIYFDPNAEKDSDLLQHMPRSGCGYAKSSMPRDASSPAPQAFIAWLTSPGPISRAVERLNSRHPVRLVWTDAGTEKEVVLIINNCEYAAVIANLRRFAGQRWPEIGHELKE